jgi:signal transduction histidine kinase
MPFGLKKLWGQWDMERRIIGFYTLAAVIITLIFSAMVTFYGAKVLGIALLLIAANNWPVLYLLRQKKTFRSASYYLISNGAFTVTFAVCFVGGLDGPVVYWLGILPLAGGLLLHSRGIFLGLLLASSSIVILALRRFIPAVYDVLIPNTFDLVISIVCFIGMISFMAYLFLQKNVVVVADQTRKLDNLLNIITHDIVNPLTLISGHAELLLHQGQGSPAHAHALHRIMRASDLINQILHKVKQIQVAKAGKLQLETKAVSLIEIFEKLRFLFEDRLQKKRQQLRIDLPAIHQDAMVEADPVMLLNEVLSNLVSNAIKFSPSGSIIDITISRELGLIRIDVKDQGIGIPKDLLPFIFDDFRSTSRPGTEGESGTGFGLSLARHIVETFGGSLRVQSRSVEEHKRNPGTVFILRLPAHQAARVQAKAS